jgi:lysophospholipase L1-like esterase
VRPFIIFFTGLYLFTGAVFAQPVPESPRIDPLAVEQYSFVNYDTNFFIGPANTALLSHFFSKLDTLMFRGSGQVNIIHIGGSHIQTDVYTHRMRTSLQNFQPGLNAGRGLVFPVAMAGSNNPRNFTVTSSGNWQSCRNTQRNRSCNLGLTGMMVATSDTFATITIAGRNAEDQYPATVIRVLYNDPSLLFRIGIATEDPYLINSIEDYRELGYTEIRLNKPVESCTLEFSRDAAGQPALFELFGIEFRTDDPGIIYHSFGVNGASIPSFLRCNLLQEHIRLIGPDLVILSLGTNDAFSKNFDAEVYRRNYSRLIDLIKTAAPQTDILITVPNDVYFNRKRTNKNTSLQEEVIYQLSETYGCGVWNFFQVMGGLNSVPNWYNNGMMQKDRIHFTPKGYLLKGDLFFNAMMKSYGKHLEELMLND